MMPVRSLCTAWEIFTLASIFLPGDSRAKVIPGGVITGSGGGVTGRARLAFAARGGDSAPIFACAK